MTMNRRYRRALGWNHLSNAGLFRAASLGIVSRFLMDPGADPTGAGGGGGGGGPKTDPPAPEPKPEPKAEDAAAGYKAALDQANGSAATLARSLYDDNARLKRELDEARGKTPKPGAIVLEGDAAKEHEAYKALGKPADLRRAIEEGEGAKAEATGLKRKETHNEAAALHGFRPTVLHKLADDDRLDIQVRDETDDKGKPIQRGGVTPKIAVVVGKDAEGKETVTPLTKYAAANWGEFKESLGVKVQGKGSPQALGSNQPRPPIEPIDEKSRSKRSLFR